MTSPSGSQMSPAIAATEARGIAIATRGTATMFAGTLVNETVPNVGSSTGNVASWAATVAVRIDTQLRSSIPRHQAGKYEYQCERGHDGESESE